MFFMPKCRLSTCQSVDFYGSASTHCPIEHHGDLFACLRARPSRSIEGEMVLYLVAIEFDVLYHARRGVAVLSNVRSGVVTASAPSSRIPGRQKSSPELEGCCPEGRRKLHCKVKSNALCLVLQGQVQLLRLVAQCCDCICNQLIISGFRTPLLRRVLKGFDAKT